MRTAKTEDAKRAVPLLISSLRKWYSKCLDDQRTDRMLSFRCTVNALALIGDKSAVDTLGNCLHSSLKSENIKAVLDALVSFSGAKVIDSIKRYLQGNDETGSY